MITAGFILMGMGMGFVFLFLSVLVLGTKLMSAIVLKFFPEKEVASKQSTSQQSVAAEVAIAIAAAKAYSVNK